MSDVVRNTPVSKQGNSNDSMSLECSGHDRYLLVFINIVDPSTSDRALTIDYNGANLTRLQGRTYSAGVAESEVWGLVNPASGNHTLSWSFAGGITEYQIIALPLAQVDISNPIDTGSGSAGAGTSRSVALSTSADRCQLYSFLVGDSSISGVNTAAGETEIAQELDSASESHASEEDVVVSPAGSESMGWNWSGSHANSLEAVAIRPSPNLILHAVPLPLGMQVKAPAGIATGKPPAFAAELTTLNAATRINAWASILNLGLSWLASALDFRMVVNLRAGARRRWFSGEGRKPQLTAKPRRMAVLTEKRNE